MSSDLHLTSEQIEASKNWIRELYKAVDSFDYDYWLKTFCKSDVSINICDQPSLIGFDKIGVHFERQKLVLTNLKHDIIAIDVLPDRIYVQNITTFLVEKDPNQQEIKIKAIAVYDKKIDEDQAATIQIVYDPLPLMKTIEMFS